MIFRVSRQAVTRQWHVERSIQEYHYLPNRGVPLGPWANANRAT